MDAYIGKDCFDSTAEKVSADEYIAPVAAIRLALAELKTPEGTFLIQERRINPRDVANQKAVPASRSFANSPQMMGLGGLIIIGVLVASYTAKYDAAIGHVNGALAVPAVGYLALQLFLARAALRLYDDIRSFPRLLDFIISRFFRYAPATVPAVLLGFVLINMLTIPGMHAPLANLPANLFLVADMVGVADIDSSHWRLKIEIIQAVLVAAAWFGPARRYLAVLLTGALVINAFSITGEPMRHNVLTLRGCMTNDGYLPLFVYGIALWQLTQDRTARIWQVMLFAAASLVFLSNTPLHGAVVVAGLMVLASLATGGLQWLGRWRWLSHMGEIAFPIYVVHYVLGFAVIRNLEVIGCKPFIAILLASTIAIIVGKALNRFIERPIQLRGPVAIKACNAALNRITGTRSIGRTWQDTTAQPQAAALRGSMILANPAVAANPGLRH